MSVEATQVEEERLMAKTVRDSLVVVVALAFAAGPALAANTWVGTTDGSWGTTANWTGDQLTSGLPNATSVNEFGDLGEGGNYAITLGANREVSGLVFKNTIETYTFAAGNTLVVGGSGFTLTDWTRDVILNGPVQLKNNSTFTGTATSGKLVLNGGLTYSGTTNRNLTVSPLTFVLGTGSSINLNRIFADAALETSGGVTFESSGGSRSITVLDFYADKGGQKRINFVGGNFTVNGAFTGDGSPATPIHIVTGDGFKTTWNGDFTGTGQTRPLNVAGGGTLVLNGTNYNWMGAINVGAEITTDLTNGTKTFSAGSLIVNSTVVASNNAVSIGTGSLLGGTGTINRNVTLTASTATLAPGDVGANGKLTVNGNVSAAGGKLAFQLAKTVPGEPVAGTDYDQLVVNGDVSINGADLVLSLGDHLKNNDVFYIVNNLGANPIDGTFASVNGVAADLEQNALFSIGSLQFRISYNAVAGSTFSDESEGRDVAILVVSVPEPGTAGLLLAAGGWWLTARRNRRPEIRNA